MNAELLPPKDLPTERAWLAACMCHGKLLAEPISPSDFYLPEHRIIAKAIVALCDAGNPADVISLGESLRRRGMEEESQYAEALFSDNTGGIYTTASQFQRYGEIIHQKAKLRRIIQRAQSLMESAYSSQEDVIAEHLDALQDIAGFGNREQQIALTPEEMERHFLEYAANLNESRMPTGIAELDARIGGVGPGQVLTILARTGVGKTAIAQNITKHAVRVFAESAAHKSVVMVSGELPQEEVFMRQVQIHAGVTERDVIRAYQQGELSRVDRDAFIAATTQRWLVIPKPRLTLRKVQRIIHGNVSLRRIFPCRVIVLDYLGLFDSGRGSRASQVEAYGAIAVEAKMMAKEMNAAVILLAQASRGAGAGWEEITATDARGSGEIEEAADFLLGIWRPGLNPELRRDRPAEWESLRDVMCWRILKGRRCPLGDFETRFDGETLTVREAG